MCSPIRWQSVVLSFAVALLFQAGAEAQTNSPGSALTFSGSQDVSIASQSSLNAYPLTITAWIKTTTTNLCGIVNKYPAGTASGYQLFLNNGHVQGFYIASAGNEVPLISTPLDGGTVNDGLWHHVALSVNATGAWLCKDGQEVDRAVWTGTPGPVSNSQNLFFGYYPGTGVSGRYIGEVDEITLWRVALYPSEIQTYMNRSLTGFEPNLIGYWRFDEGTGTTATDVSGNGNIGHLENSPVWTASTAPIGIVPPTGYSQQWTQIPGTPSVTWFGVTCSADGTHLAATAYGNGIYTSTNSGTNWQLTTAPVAPWFGIAGSANGRKLIAANNTIGVYLSTNAGAAWYQANLPTNGSWENVACSADGSRMVAATFSGGLIYVSSDSGATWSNTIGITYCTSLAASSDGMKLAAIGPQIYTSTNGGMNWITNNAPNLNWNKIASSADGTKLLAAVFSYLSSSNYLYLSTDSGATWQATTAPSNSWNAVAMSADGSKMLASLSPGTIYVSTDFGASWNPTDAASDYWDEIATSVDGTKSVALSSHVIASLLPPKLHVAKSAASATVSWPSPSTGFNLQQSATLGSASWTNVPFRPAVTNSENQVTLGGNGNSFYRLVFP